MQKADDLADENQTPKKSRTSLAETPRTRIYRSRSVKESAKTPERDKGKTKSVPVTPKSGDKKRKRTSTEGENVFQAAHFDSESEVSMAESDDEEELRRKKKIRKVRNVFTIFNAHNQFKFVIITIFTLIDSDATSSNRFLKITKYFYLLYVG